MEFHPVCIGEVDIGEHIILVRRLTRPSVTVRRTFHRLGQFRMGATGLICDGTPGGVSFFSIGRSERIAQQCRQTRLLRFGDTREQVPCRMNPAALPCRALKDFEGGRFQAFMRIGDDKLYAFEAPLHETAQELHPEHHCLAVADRKPDDFPSAIGIGRDGYYGRNTDSSCALTDLEVSHIEPDIGPLTLPYVPPYIREFAPVEQIHGDQPFSDRSRKEAIRSSCGGKSILDQFLVRFTSITFLDLDLRVINRTKAAGFSQLVSVKSGSLELEFAENSLGHSTHREHEEAPFPRIGDEALVVDGALDEPGTGLGAVEERGGQVHALRHTGGDETRLDRDDGDGGGREALAQALQEGREAGLGGAVIIVARAPAVAGYGTDPDEHRWHIGVERPPGEGF